MAIEHARSAAFRRINIVVASAIVTLIPALAYAVQLARREAPYALRDLTWAWAESLVRWFLIGGTILGFWLAAAMVLSVLTSIETRGIRLFGRLRRSRITAAVAHSITAHATAGWIAGSVLAAGGFVLGLALYERAMHENVGAVRGLFMLGPIWIPFGALLLGILCFDVIVYVGVRSCRFANRAEGSVTACPLRSQHGSTPDRA
jgi:hypothetical protein